MERVVKLDVILVDFRVFAVDVLKRLADIVDLELFYRRGAFDRLECYSRFFWNDITLPIERTIFDKIRLLLVQALIASG
jgi:hypothetical protein